jgi:hypothetical protein
VTTSGAVVMLLIHRVVRLDKSDRLARRNTAMNLLWIRPMEVEQSFPPDERRVRDFVDSPAGMSESADSLADKLGISSRRCRRILEELVEQGVVQRREFADIQPLYVRFPSR